jgi:glucose-6-phosphate 1-dehydrogenase
VGVESRARYYEEAGVVRDMFQNHLFQLLSLTAMELPVDMSANAVRDEKVKLLKQVVPLGPDFDANTVRAQYSAGTIKGAAAQGYREEPGVDANSVTPTYAAMRVQVNNWRWQGVPFYLRSGKRMGRRAPHPRLPARPSP